LVKPQFEVGKGLVGKGGVVRDASHHKAVVSRVARYCVLHGWHARGVTVSPLKGPKGNREFFLHLTRTGRTAADLDQLIARAAETPDPERSGSASSPGPIGPTRPGSSPGSSPGAPSTSYSRCWKRRRPGSVPRRRRRPPASQTCPRRSISCSCWAGTARSCPWP